MLPLALLVTNLLEAEPIVVSKKKGAQGRKEGGTAIELYRKGDIAKEEYNRMRAREYYAKNKDKYNKQQRERRKAAKAAKANKVHLVKDE